MRILDFKTTWSEFQKESQTATKRGEALYLKTTWSEFQKPCQTAAAGGKFELRIYDLKKTSPTQSRSLAVVCVSTPRMYPRSGYFLVTTIRRVLIVSTRLLGKGAGHPKANKDFYADLKLCLVSWLLLPWNVVKLE